jgi:hypothetical protein
MKKVLIVIVVVVVAGGIIAYSKWNQSIHNPLRGDAIKVTAVQLFSDFSTNEAAAQKKYVPVTNDDKVVEVSGTVNTVGSNADGGTFYELKTDDPMFVVKCVLEGKPESKVKAGEFVTVRGYCNGYNMDVIMNRCRVVK